MKKRKEQTKSQALAHSGDVFELAKEKQTESFPKFSLQNQK